MPNGESFVDEVKDIVGPVLANKRFALVDSFSGSDRGGRRLSIAYFRNGDCKIQVYSWEREGETNCMIGLLDAPNEFGLLSDSGRWQFLTRFVERPDLPLAEIASRARAEYENRANPLEWVSDRIDRFYDVALAGMKELYGPSRRKLIK